MREFAFRVWDKVQKEIFHLNEDDDWDYYLSNEDGRFIAMQYTGIEDKNGNEIYEGDICKSHEFSKTQLLKLVGALGHIDFVFGQFRFIGQRASLVVSIDSCVLEVIGNIYENPELLRIGK